MDCLDQIKQEFSVINASGVFFHLEELHSVTEAVKKALKSNGVFIVQFLYMKNILENDAFDQIYHEHLLYYSLKTLETLLNLHELSIFDAELTKAHGGQMIAYISHKNSFKKTNRLSELIELENVSECNKRNAYTEFQKRIIEMKDKNLSFLYDAKRLGKLIYGMGAPVKGNTLLNYFEIDTNLITCLLEKNTLREGLFSPGSHIPIFLESKMKPADVYFVLAWNFKHEILKNNQALIDNGAEFYFPVDVK